jgi:hypothetical protein
MDAPYGRLHGLVLIGRFRSFLLYGIIYLGREVSLAFFPNCVSHLMTLYSRREGLPQT